MLRRYCLTSVVVSWLAMAVLPLIARMAGAESA